MIRAAWSGFFIALGVAVALLYFDAPASFVNVAVGLAFVCAAPICFNAFRDLARLFQR